MNFWAFLDKHVIDVTLMIFFICISIEQCIKAWRGSGR